MIKLIHLFLLIALTNNTVSAQVVATPGQPLPAWENGFLDLHHYTGRCKRKHAGKRNIWSVSVKEKKLT